MSALRHLPLVGVRSGEPQPLPGFVPLAEERLRAPASHVLVLVPASDQALSREALSSVLDAFRRRGHEARAILLGLVDDALEPQVTVFDGVSRVRVGVESLDRAIAAIDVEIARHPAAVWVIVGGAYLARRSPAIAVLVGAVERAGDWQARLVASACALAVPSLSAELTDGLADLVVGTKCSI